MSVKSRTELTNKTRKQSAKSFPWDERVFQELVENMSDGVYFINADGYFRYVNKAFSDRTGIPQEQYPKLHFLDLIDPDYHELATKNFQRALKGEDGFPYELRSKDIAGQAKIVEVHSRPVRDGGKVIGIFGVSREITKRRLAEDLLHQSEARYRSVVEDQEEMICRYLPDCTLTFVNTAYCRYFGKTRDELLGQKFQTLITGEELKMVSKSLTALTPERPITVHEQTALAAGSEIRWQQWVTRALFDKQGNRRELQAVGRDITERKRVEDALRESEDRFRSLSEAAFEAIVIHDDGVVLSANPQYFEMFGYAPNELLGRQAIPLTVAPESIKTMSKQFAEGDLGPYEAIGMKKDGTQFPMEIRVRKMENKGRMIRVGAILDISEHKRIEGELKRHREHLEKLVKERTAELENKTGMLEELNVALKVLLRQSGVERTEMEERFISNVKSLILPYVEKIKSGPLDTHQKSCLDIIESNLNEIISPFVQKMRHHNFTLKELTVASLIKDGRTTKEIAKIMGVGTHAINSHRNHIRRKIGLGARRTNLQSHLQSFE